MSASALISCCSVHTLCVCDGDRVQMDGKTVERYGNAINGGIKKISICRRGAWCLILASLNLHCFFKCSFTEHVWVDVMCNLRLYHVKCACSDKLQYEYCIGMLRAH